MQMNRKYKAEGDYPKKLSIFYLILFPPTLYSSCYLFNDKLSLMLSTRPLSKYSKIFAKINSIESLTNQELDNYIVTQEL